MDEDVTAIVLESLRLERNLSGNMANIYEAVGVLVMAQQEFQAAAFKHAWRSEAERRSVLFVNLTRMAALCIRAAVDCELV